MQHSILTSFLVFSLSLSCLDKKDDHHSLIQIKQSIFLTDQIESLLKSGDLRLKSDVENKKETFNAVLKKYLPHGDKVNLASMPDFCFDLKLLSKDSFKLYIRPVGLCQTDIAYLIAYTKWNAMIVNSIEINARYRKRSFGRLLMGILDDSAIVKSFSYDRIMLQSVLSAEGFYQKLGFKRLPNESFTSNDPVLAEFSSQFTSPLLPIYYKVIS